MSLDHNELKHIEAWTKWLQFWRQHFQFILMNENEGVWINTSLNFARKGPKIITDSDNGFRWTGNKPLPEPMAS